MTDLGASDVIEKAIKKGLPLAFGVIQALPPTISVSRNVTPLAMRRKFVQVPECVDGVKAMARAEDEGLWSPFC